MIRIALAAGLLAASLAHAQSTPGQANTPAASAAKKELVAKILKLQQPGIEGVARQLVQQPALQLMQQAGPVIQQRVAADRRQAVATDIQADVRKYAEELTPVAIDRAGKLAPGILGPMLEEKFTEDELKQLITIIESPVNRKYQAMGVDMQKALGEKLVAELKPTLEPKLRALQQSMATRMAPAASGATTAPK